MKPFAAFLLFANVIVAAPAPTLFQTAPGRIEVAAVDAAAARTVVALADEAWRALAAPLGLPEAFSSPVFVRLVPAAEWTDVTPFRAVVEAGGVVSVRIGWSDATPDLAVRRALVQGLLLRLAVSRHGVSERLTAPLWLEQAGVGWWRTRADGAQLDALKQATERVAPPALADLLSTQRGGTEPPEQALAAVWLMTFLQGEGTAKAGEWRALVQRLLAGEEPLAALTASFPGRFAGAAERELWWQTGWHQVRRARTLPGLEAAESRQEIEALSRFVFVAGGREAVMPLAEVAAHRRDPAVQAELQRRAAALSRVMAALHPFYRNAGLSLAEVLGDGGATEKERAARVPAFERDWRDATELEAATQAALDALEQRGAR